MRHSASSGAISEGKEARKLVTGEFSATICLPGPKEVRGVGIIVTVKNDPERVETRDHVAGVLRGDGIRTQKLGGVVHKGKDVFELPVRSTSRPGTSEVRHDAGPHSRGGNAPCHGEDTKVWHLGLNTDAASRVFGQMCASMGATLVRTFPRVIGSWHPDSADV